MAELHQLIEQLATKLRVHAEPPAVYQSSLDAVVYYSTTGDTPVPGAEGLSAAPPVRTPRATASVADDQYPEAEDVLAKHCEREWPDDYSMRDYCMSQQRHAVAQLRQGRPGDIPDAVFQQIRRKCAREWTDDYSMRRYSEDQQFAAYRKVQPAKGG